MRSLFVLPMTLALGGCLMTAAPEVPPPQVTVSGPLFPAGQFDCGVRPLPPDPHAAGDRAASAAARYEDGLGTWGQHCSNKLRATGAALRAAGQVIDPAAAAVRP